jgi:hypothetical protein
VAHSLALRAGSAVGRELDERSSLAREAVLGAVGGKEKARGECARLGTEAAAVSGGGDRWGRTGRIRPSAKLPGLSGLRVLSSRAADLSRRADRYPVLSPVRRGHALTWPDALSHPAEVDTP